MAAPSRPRATPASGRARCPTCARSTRSARSRPSSASWSRSTVTLRLVHRLGRACTPAWPDATRCPLSIVLSLIVTQVLARGMTSPLREMTAAARRDGPRRLLAGGSARPATTRSASWPRRSTGWPRTSRRRPAAPRARRQRLATSCARRSPRCRRCWRTSSTASPSRTRRRCETALAPDRAARPAGRAAARPVPARGRRRAAGARRRCGCRSSCARRAERRPARRPAGTCGSRSTSSRPTCRCSADRERLHQVLANLLRQRDPALPARRRRSGCGATPTSRGDVRIDVVDEGPGIAAARPGPRLRAVPPRRARATGQVSTAAPGSAWPSPAGSSTCTAAASGSSTPSRAARSASTLPGAGARPRARSPSDPLTVGPSARRRRRRHDLETVRDLGFAGKAAIAALTRACRAGEDAGPASRCPFSRWANARRP